jgi:exo-1,4-beta-D-glucosaminidase
VNPAPSRRAGQLTVAVVGLALAAALGGCERPGATRAEPTVTAIALRDGWQIRAAAEVSASGAEIARPGFATAGWVSTSVPSTVLAALVGAGKVADPYFGDNLEKIATEPFSGPWWYRTEFTVEEPLPAEARLVFEGINYSADVWLNGQRLAGRDAIAGAFRVFELDATPHLLAGPNALAVEVHPPRPGDPTIGFVDWNPKPPDRSLGLWRGVELRRTAGLSLEEVFVRSDLDPGNLAQARLTVSARLRNHTGRAVSARLRGRIGPGAPIEVERVVELAPGEESQVALAPADFPQLVLASPRLWWPNNMGAANLYELELEVDADGRVSDHREVSFGIRHVADYLNEQGHRGYKVNGRPVLVRGGGWVDDLLLADDDRRLADQIRYVRHMNLNTIRLEGFWGSSQELFDLADREGIMVWAGWSCQWEWENYFGQPVDEEFGGIDTPAEMELVTRSLRDQVVWLRNHPSVVVWNLASDMLPKPELERRYRTLLAEVDPTRPPLAACSVRTSEVSGPTAVKMNGPYEWVPPDYWYLDRERGGAYGFNTETGPGAQPPVAASIRRMLPEKSWWPIDGLWSFHSGRGEFDNLDYYVKALEARYGKARDLDDFSLKAQATNYEAMRAMFEAFSLRRPVATGVIQWMLNSAWPDMWWQLYDWYLTPTGAYYAARNANRPLHIAYDYAERKVVAVNDQPGAALRGAQARVRVLGLGSEVRLDETRPVDLEAGSRQEVLALPPSNGAEPYFLDARILGADGAPLATNFYWLPARPDVLDWEKSEWYYTPVRRFADLTALDRLPAAELRVGHRFAPAPEGWQAVEVTLENAGPKVAFFVELEVAGGKSGRLAAPILWDDNYVSLLPGEKREIRGLFPPHALAADDPPLFRYRGMNVKGD